MKVKPDNEVQLVTDLFEQFLMNYMDRDTRKAAKVYLFHTVEQYYKDFSTPEIPNTILDQAEAVARDFRSIFKNKTKVIIKHRNEFRAKVALLCS